MVWGPLLGLGLLLVGVKVPQLLDTMLMLIGSTTSGASIFLAGLIIAAYDIGGEMSRVQRLYQNGAALFEGVRVRERGEDPCVSGKAWGCEGSGLSQTSPLLRENCPRTELTLKNCSIPTPKFGESSDFVFAF